YLNDDARNLERYDRGEEEFGVRGVFRLEDGGVMRHHTKARIESLFTDFEMLDHQDFSAMTMNGNASRAFQLVGRKPFHADAEPTPSEQAHRPNASTKRGTRLKERIPSYNNEYGPDKRGSGTSFVDVVPQGNWAGTVVVLGRC
ncbi:MAG: hypothetical protein KDA60_11315, partial [Planctomycetales bacterium]|nr:hypothetical protein [Planctomycetales bacterium]